MKIIKSPNTSSASLKLYQCFLWYERYRITAAPRNARTATAAFFLVYFYPSLECLVFIGNPRDGGFRTILERAAKILPGRAFSFIDKGFHAHSLSKWSTVKTRDCYFAALRFGLVFGQPVPHVDEASVLAHGVESRRLLDPIAIQIESAAGIHPGL